MFGYDLKSLGGETMSYFLVSFPYSNKRLEKVEAEKYLLNEWMNEYKVGTAITMKEIILRKNLYFEHDAFRFF